MAPKNKFTREEIVQAALDITRSGGIAAVTARALGAKLGASSKPIFSHFQNMDEVLLAVKHAAYALYGHYLTQGMSSGQYPPYKASGMAYIRFAKEEKELFKLLFMCERSPEEANRGADDIQGIIQIIQKNTGLSYDLAFMFHMEMWIYVHGIATMIVTAYLDWDWDMISTILTDAYEGIKHRFANKE